MRGAVERLWVLRGACADRALDRIVACHDFDGEKDTLWLCGEQITEVLGRRLVSGEGISTLQGR